MTVPLILAAGLLSAPIFNSTQAVDNYPAKYVRENKSAAAEVQVIVSPEGRLVQCQVLSTAGDLEFAQGTCALLNPRTWRAARDSSGKPVFGLVRTVFKWLIPGSKEGDEIASMTQRPDVVLTLNKLPSDAKEPLEVKVSVDVDARGRVTACEPRPRSRVSPTLMAAACESVGKVPIGPAFLSGSLLPRFVMEVTVGFTVEQPR